jgi:hypothetical protein
VSVPLITWIFICVEDYKIKFVSRCFHK